MPLSPLPNYHSRGRLHLEKNILNFLKMATSKICEQYYNVAPFPVWLQIQYGQMLLFLDRLQVFFKQL